MGIKNFTKFVEKYAPDALIKKTINDYKNKVIGIDANLLLYKLIFAIRKNGYDIKNNDKIVTHIFALQQKLKKFKKLNINAVFVFDGKPPKIKYKTLKNRDEAKQKIINKYKHDKSEKGKRIYYYTKSEITNEEITECKELIKLYGYQVIESLQEADAQLAQLSKEGSIDYIASEDADILMFGGKKLLKNFTINETKKITEINLATLLKKLKMTQDELIVVGLLLGSDYCYNKSTSIKKTYDMIKNNTYNLDCEKAINFFNDPLIERNIKIEKDKEINTTALEHFLTNHGFT